MSSNRADLLVVYTDGEEVKVRAGQTDVAAWDRWAYSESLGGMTAQTAPTLFSRYVAWRALWRTRALPRGDDGKSLTFEQWDNVCDYVDAMDGSEQGPPDPTVTAPPPED